MADEKVPGRDYDIRYPADFVIWGDVLPLVAARCKTEGVRVEALLEVALNHTLQSFLQDERVAGELIELARAVGGNAQ
jgi:hypothetical protein